MAWLIQENGALSETRRGDYGESVGLCMCHTRYRKCEFTYEGQKDQCLDWFKGYTEKSTKDTIYKDIRHGHNRQAGAWYTNGIRSKEKLLTYK